VLQGGVAQLMKRPADAMRVQVPSDTRMSAVHDIVWQRGRHEGVSGNDI
jgi:hypothetical protein